MRVYELGSKKGSVKDAQEDAHAIEAFCAEAPFDLLHDDMNRFSEKDERKSLDRGGGNWTRMKGSQIDARIEGRDNRQYLVFKSMGQDMKT